MNNVTQFPDLGSQITQKIIKAGIEVHRHMGPGLLESVYEACLEIEFQHMGLSYERQKALPITYNGVTLKETFRADFIVEDKVIIELKSVEKLVPVHEAQLLSYMKLGHIPLGLLMNFNSVLLKDGIRRIALGNPAQN